MTIVEAPPIACTLAPGAFKDRLASIAALNKDALRKYERRDLVLELRYAPEARERVLEMVRNEQACCAFLAFELDEDENEIRLTITAPERAREAADGLFAAVRGKHSGTIVMRVRSFGIHRQDPFKGAAGFEGRRRHGRHACDGRSCLWRVLRAAVCTSGNDSRHYRLLVGVVRQTSSLGHHPCHPLGRRCMGVDRLADAPHEQQASGINARDDGRGDSAADSRRAMAPAREAPYLDAAGVTPLRFDPLP